MASTRFPARAVSLALAILLTPYASAFPPDIPPPECFEESAFPGADVLFVLDLTGSMGGVLESAKTEATAIMGDLAAAVGDIRFGAASHMDYPAHYSYPGYSSTYGSPGDYPWRLDQDITTDTAAVQAAINALALGNGADGPESYVTAMYEATESVSWGGPRVKVVVFFADNVPHDMDWNGRNTGGEPGRDGVAMTADDLDWQTVVSGMAAAGIRVVGIDSGGGHEMMGYLADETGGDWTTLSAGAAFRQTVVDMVVGVVGGPTPHDDQPPTVAFASPVSPRLLVDGADAGPSPFAETTLVNSDLPLSLTAADDCKLKRVELRDGAAHLASFTDFPLDHTYLAASLPPGLHTLTAVATDWVGQTATATLPVRILELDERAHAQGLFVGVNVPASAEAHAGLASARGAGGADSSTYGARTLTTLAGDVRYETIRSTAESHLDGSLTATASATTTLSRVDLLGGRIVADTVRAVSSVAKPLAGDASLDTAGSVFVGLVVDGVPMGVAPGETVDVALPGLGFVRFFEVQGATTARAVQQVNMIHVFVETPSLKGEIVVGSAFAAAGLLDDGDAPRRELDAADDAGTDADAGAGVAQATPIAPGLYSGRVGPGDAADTYTFGAVEGDRIVLGFVAAPRAAAYLAREPSAQPLDAGATLVTSTPVAYLELLDPTGRVRDRTHVAGDRIEFNADVDGAWYARVLANGEPEARNYTLALDLAPVVFLPGDDLDGDAPASCANARLVEHGLHAGVMRGADAQDAWAFPVALGELVTVALKPDELDDGANFDLMLFGPDCEFLGFSELGEAQGTLPKGTPDLVAQLPAHRTGIYRAIVYREDGVGNYYLDVRSTNPMPTLPANDAGTGRDTTGPADAIGIESPGAAQGRFPDESDREDWYAVTGAPGETMRVVVQPSALSVLRVTLLRLDFSTAAAGESLLGAPVALTAPADSYYVLVERVSGGGNYLVAAASTAR